MNNFAPIDAGASAEFERTQDRHRNRIFSDSSALLMNVAAKNIVPRKVITPPNSLFAAAAPVCRVIGIDADVQRRCERGPEP